MEDDDEFGDLYTDVLRPLSSSLSSGAPPPVPSPAPPSLYSSIDLNLSSNNNHRLGDDHDAQILTNSSSVPNNSIDNSIDNNLNNYFFNNKNNSARVLSSSLDVKLPSYPRGDDDDFNRQDKDINFDIEEQEQEVEDNSGPVIPGLHVASADVENVKKKSVDEAAGVAGGGSGGDNLEEEEDSDSEDDLQIVLNDNNNLHHHHGPMIIGDGDDLDDDDDDEDPLVIVDDGDANQATEEQEWGGIGEDGAAAAAPSGVEGERKEGGGETAGKGNVMAGPKFGYSNHVYHHHPFHSQFKYVRPGAAPMPGAPAAGPGGAPGQVRPPINLAPVAGRGRGDWRPAGVKNVPLMQKGYHPGFGMPWGSNVAGRGFGGGLEFTLPSHKTIFDVDIDSFEEKPWKYSGVDVSDFFNFGLNEDSWKDYCKQLEQHRLETTMQSKIRVYESGRAEQEYDPDLPPELAAAAGMHDIAADNSNLGKSDAGQSDLTRGPTRVRPPLPTGRAIQVEGGYGERLPSIDTRPPRIRDSDAIIEIVLQDSLDDDSSAGNGGVDGANNDLPRDDLRESHVHDDDVAQTETNYYDDDFPQSYDGQKGGRRVPYIDSGRNSTREGDEVLPSRPEESSPYPPGPRGQPVMSGGDFGSPDEGRQRQGRTHDRSPDSTPSRITRDRGSLDNVEKESVESMDGRQRLSVSPAAVREARELSDEDRDVAVPGERMPAEVSSGVERDEMTENEATTNDSIKDGDAHYSTKKQKVSHVEQSVLQEIDDGEDSRAARSSENSKARSGSSKDYQKWQDGVEEEVMQDGRARHTGNIRRHADDNEPNFRRKEHDARQEMERNHIVRKGREGSYPHRELDPSLAYFPHVRNEGYDKRKERENSDGAFQRGEEDLHIRKGRIEDTRKRERVDEMASRHRSKIREGERGDKEEHLYSRKQLDNGSHRVHYDKDGSTRHREREDSLKIRYDIVDDYHSKRRKDEEYLRRDYADKEEILHVHRETTSRRRRERDDVLDPRKRDDQQRVRDSLDDYHSVRHKDEVWLQRERGERQREREELYRQKQSHEENLTKREKEDGRGTVRAGRSVDDKAWINHARGKDEYRGSEKEYQLKDAVRNSEQQKRRDRVEDEGYSHHRGRDDAYARGNQLGNEERRSRQERSSIRIDRSTDTPDNQRVHERKHKDNTRKNKDSGGDHSTSGSSRRNQEDQSGHTGEMGLKGSTEQGNGQSEIAMRRNSSKRHKDDASSDEEQQDTKRGRSKLERWTSHKERDYSINSKSSASLKFKERDRSNKSGSVEANKLPEELPKRPQAVDKHPIVEEKDGGDVENKDSDIKPLEDRHLDTVEKLKKRSERFKLPMPSEKDAPAVKKIEVEAPPPVKTDTPVDLEIKPERPARKRRWISS